MPLATRNKNCCHCCTTNSTSIDFYRLYFIGSFRYMHSNYGGDLNDRKNLILLVPVLSCNLFALSDFSFAIILKQKEHSPLKHWNLFHLWVQNLKRMTTNVNACSLSGSSLRLMYIAREFSFFKTSGITATTTSSEGLLYVLYCKFRSRCISQVPQVGLEWRELKIF